MNPKYICCMVISFNYCISSAFWYFYLDIYTCRRMSGWISTSSWISTCSRRISAGSRRISSTLWIVAASGVRLMVSTWLDIWYLDILSFEKKKKIKIKIKKKKKRKSESYRFRVSEKGERERETVSKGKIKRLWEREKASEKCR